MFPLLIIFVPVLSALLISVLDRNLMTVIKVTSLFSSAIVLVCSAVIWISYSPGTVGFLGGVLYTFETTWVGSQLGAALHFGVDGLSLVFVMFNSLVVFALVAGGAVSERKKTKGFYLCLNLLAGLTAGLYFSMDILLFYFFWELMLLPVYCILSKQKDGSRFYSAGKFLFMHITAGALFLLVIMQLSVLSSQQSFGPTMLIENLYRLGLSPRMSFTLFWLLAVVLLARAAFFPFHRWFTKSAAEMSGLSPGIVSLIYIKGAVYAFIRLLVPLFPLQAFNAGGFVVLLGSLGIIYFYFISLRQKKVKDVLVFIIPAQLGFVFLGFFSLKPAGISGAVFFILAQTLNFTVFFLLLEFFKAEKSKKVKKRKLRSTENNNDPALQVIFTAVAFASFISLPGTASFVGLLMIFSSSGSVFTIATLLAAGGVVMSGFLFTLFIYEADRISFDTINSARCTVLVLPLIFLIIWLGLFPGGMLARLEPSIENILAETAYFSEDSTRTELLKSEQDLFELLFKDRVI